MKPSEYFEMRCRSTDPEDIKMNERILGLLRAAERATLQGHINHGIDELSVWFTKEDEERIVRAAVSLKNGGEEDWRPPEDMKEAAKFQKELNALQSARLDTMRFEFLQGNPGFLEDATLAYHKAKEKK